MSLVVDASVAMKWLLPESYSEECLELLESGQTITAPDLLFSQVGSALAKRVKAGELKAPWVESAMAALLKLPIVVVPTRDLADDAMILAGQGKRSFSDAVYLALAVREGVPLTTADWRWFSLSRTGPLKDHIQFVRPT